MAKLKFVLPALILGAGILATTSETQAKPAFSAKTKKACNFCHVDAKTKPKELTPAGKYYQEKNTLDGYVEKKQS